MTSGPPPPVEELERSMTDEYAPLRMAAVHCDLCGEHLGFQPHDVPVQPGQWIHARCPVRVAEQWGIPRDDVTELTELISASVASCYPEIPDAIALSGPGDRTLSRLRGDIAAGQVLEVLATWGFRIGRQG